MNETNTSSAQCRSDDIPFFNVLRKWKWKKIRRRIPIDRLHLESTVHKKKHLLCICNPAMKQQFRVETSTILFTFHSQTKPAQRINTDANTILLSRQRRLTYCLLTLLSCSTRGFSHITSLLPFQYSSIRTATEPVLSYISFPLRINISSRNELNKIWRGFIRKLIALHILFFQSLLFITFDSIN